MIPGVGSEVGGVGQSPGRVASLASPLAVARGGPLSALPCLGQFGPQKSVRELSARAGAPRGAGWARPSPVPDPARDPRPPARALHPAARPAGRVPRPLARSLAWFSSLAGRPAGGRRRPPPGAEACQAGGEGRAAATLAMSSPHDASGDFPLHLLVWNNDYRQLEKELRDQVRG